MEGADHTTFGNLNSVLLRFRLSPCSDFWRFSSFVFFHVSNSTAEIMSRDPEGRSAAVFRVRFLSFFGVDPAVVAKAWNMIQVPYYHDGDLSHAQPKHILWALLFLKKYGDESEMAALCGEDGSAVDEKTFRKWRDVFVHCIASLKYDVVSGLLVLSLLLRCCVGAVVLVR